MSETPATLVERREQLRDRVAKLDGRIAGRIKLRDEIEERGDEPPFELSEEIGNLLKASADAVEYLNDTFRESTVLLYEQQERDRAGAFKTAEGRVADVRSDAPAGLEGKELEEIIFVLRTKHKWTWQAIVDWLVAKGVTKKRGGSNWHTSDVYAIHKKGFKQAAA
jgi:hypothetical protein